MAKIKYTMALVKEKAAQYQDATEQVEIKRTLWKGSTKALIHKVLAKVKRANRLNWKLGKVEENKNLEAVTLAFLDEPSGITGEILDEETQKTSTQELTKFGGALVFSQTYNGDVLTIVTLPAMEGDEQPQVSSIVDRVSPNDITEEYLLEQVVVFLDAMTEWESSVADKSHIGFKI